MYAPLQTKNELQAAPTFVFCPKIWAKHGKFDGIPVRISPRLGKPTSRPGSIGYRRAQPAAQAREPRAGGIEWRGRDRIADVGRLWRLQTHALVHSQIRQTESFLYCKTRNMPKASSSASTAMRESRLWRARRLEHSLAARQRRPEMKLYQSPATCSLAPHIVARSTWRRGVDDEGVRGSDALSGGGSSMDRDRQEGLLTLAVALRPELHRHCSRLMGSVIDGEDLVQDTFARAFVALPTRFPTREPRPLRWPATSRCSTSATGTACARSLPTT
jgi:hypothetical protein